MIDLDLNNPNATPSEEPVAITLRFKDDFASQYNGNQENELPFEEVGKLLVNRPVSCHFQRLKEFEQTNKVTGRISKTSTHKILIPIGNDKAIEGTLSLFKDEYSYRIVKLKQVNFFKSPSKHAIQRSCLIAFRSFNDYKGFTSSEEFTSLYSSIEGLTIPVKDLNKEKDRLIWSNYVTALKRLVKQKEQVWKIQKVSQPYFETKDESSERFTYIDIKIDERDLVRAFERDIGSSFSNRDLEDFGVNDEKAFLEFANYRLLTGEEHSKLKELGEDLFYELSPNSPYHYISGEIALNMPDTQSKRDLFRAISEKLKDEYQLDASISESGYVSITNEEAAHLLKVINDGYGNLISILPKNQVLLKVSLDDRDRVASTVKRLQTRLNTDGLRKHVISTSSNGEIVVEVAAPIHRNKFDDEGVNFLKSISRFEASRPIQAMPIAGLEIDANRYQIVNASKWDIDESLNLLTGTFPGVRFSRLPTLYFFKISSAENLSELRTFKTNTDVPGKSDFSIPTLTLKITPVDANDYQKQVERIRKAAPTSVIEEKIFTPSFHIQLKVDSETVRQDIINRIQNEIRSKIQSKVDFDVVKNWSKLVFSFPFESIEQRDKFKKAAIESCTSHGDLCKVSFEGELGKSVYEWRKNETLELEKEKEVQSSIRRATFVYITPDQKQQLTEAIERFGDDAKFMEGIPIGQLISKNRDNLKFLINREFDELVNARQEDRIDLAEFAKGFIKPIFPGELANITRMIRAMRKVTEPGPSVGYPVNRNLSNFLFDPNESRLPQESLEQKIAQVLPNLNEPLLKEQPKQLDAVAKALLATDLSLIQGPPGTGKTTVIAEIIWQTLLSNPEAKILITSQTNLAVDNALERLSGKKLVRPVRIGNTDKFENEGKVYSNDRMKKWLQAKPGSVDESNNKDNAINEWIENIKSKCHLDPKYGLAIGKWTTGLSESSPLIKGTFSNAYYKNVNVFAATCSECGSRNFGEAFQSMFQKNSDKTAEPEFDLVIMDEASKATPPELVLPLTLGKKVVIIGDHKQLPPMIDEQEFSEALESIGAEKLIDNWTRDDYKISQFEKLFKNAPKAIVTSLDTQFRMHEQIMNCISQFYTDQVELEQGLICGIRNEMDVPDFRVSGSRWHGIKAEPFIDINSHAIWVNVETPESKVGTSYENDGEVKAIQTILRVLTKAPGYKQYFDNFKKEEDKEIGIISYYVPQMKNIRNLLYPNFSAPQWKTFDLHKFENEFGVPFRINTVDRFQGMERNIVIISTVRSDKQLQTDARGKPFFADNTRYPFALGFARELQRINVGFSRAKRLLIVVGNERHFSSKQEYADAIGQMHRVDIRQLENLTSF